MLDSGESEGTDVTSDSRNFLIGALLVFGAIALFEYAANDSAPETPPPIVIPSSRDVDYTQMCIDDLQQPHLRQYAEADCAEAGYSLR